MVENINYNKRAVTYSLLAHIRNSGSLSKGPLDIFVPIVKKALHLMNESGQYKGEHISEIQKILYKEYAIDIPIPVLKSILKLIVAEVNKEEELFALYDDGGFWIRNYVFSDYDEKLKESDKAIKELQKLFKAFCDINDIKDKEQNNLIKFIEKNKLNLSQYISEKAEISNQDFNIEAKFIRYFKDSPAYDQIKKLYIGAILTSYLEYSPTNIKIDVDLLFDTNFIISLLDLNTPESTHTCKKLLEIGKELGFTFHVLIDTIEETQGLLKYKADNFDSSVIQKYINKEDIYNACTRLKYNKIDLERISDNLKEKIESFGIVVVPNTTKLKNIAKYSEDYKQLRSIRNTAKSALHDATCITYVKEKRGGKLINSFEKVNCWFVNNAISYTEYGSFEINKLSKRKGLSETIRVDNLLNILWLSNPFLNLDTNLEIAEIGLTSLVASTLNDALPKSRIIKELDDNIQKYKNASITEKDVYMLSLRIANGQIQDVEKINELAKNDVDKFNERVKEEVAKQEKLEQEKIKKLDETLEKFSKAIEDVKGQKVKIEKQSQKEVEYIENKHKTKLQEKDKEIESLKNKIKDQEKEKYISSEIKKWRNWLWLYIPIALIIIVFYIMAIWVENNQFNIGKKVLDFIDTRDSETLKGFLSAVFYLPLIGLGKLLLKIRSFFSKKKVNDKKEELINSFEIKQASK